MTPAETAALITDLEGRLAARRGQPGWADNCKAILAKIDKLKASP